MVPTVHLNGTSRGALLEETSACASAVSEAIRVLQASGPHGRDYYTQGDYAIQRAIAEHSLRIGKLKDVYAELTELYNAIYAQGGRR